MSFELASAYVRIFVEDSAVNKSLGNIRNNLSGTTASMQKGMAGVRTGMNGTMTQLNRGVIQFTRNFKKIAAPILQVSKWYMAAVTGLATKALHALYGDDSEAGRRWKKTFDVFKIRLNAEMARIANILLKVPIFGRTIPAWMDKLINFLRSMDLTKIKEMVRLFEKAALVVAGIKVISIAGNVADGLTGMGKAIERSSKLNVASNIGGGLLGGLGGGAAAGAVYKMSRTSAGPAPGMLFPWIKTEANLLKNNLSKMVAYLGISAKSMIPKIPSSALTSKIADIFKEIGLKINKVLNIKVAPNLFKSLAPKMWGTQFTGGIMAAGTSAIKAAGAFDGFFGKLWKGILKFTMLFETIAGLLSGFGLDIRGGFDLIKQTLSLIGNIFIGLWRSIETIGLTFYTGAKRLAIAMNPANWIGKGKGLDYVSKKMEEEKEATAIKLGNIWSPLKDYPNTTNARERQLNLGGFSGTAKREKFTGSYMGLTEGVKFAQDIQKKDNEYLKNIADSTKELARLAQGR
jgi:hypothetical protein